MEKKKISEVQKSVEEILKINLAARDNDVTLYAEYLKGTGYNIETKTAKDLLMKMHGKEIAHYDTVSRARRLLQQRKPELRGQFYGERQSLTRSVKSDLGYKPKKDLPINNKVVSIFEAASDLAKDIN